MSEAATTCDFGRMESEDTKNGFGFYQDNITISLECKDGDAARGTERRVQNVETVKKTMADTSTTITNSWHQFASKIGLGPLIHFFLRFQGGYGYSRSSGVNLAHGNTHEIPFSQLGCFFVHDKSIPQELRFNFQYPQNVLQEIASSDLSEIKTQNTFEPRILGNWVDLNMNERNEYVFRVERHIVSKEHLRSSLKHIGDPPFTRKHYEINFDRSTDTHVPIDEGIEVPPLTMQCYEVTLWINHAMSNLPRKNTMTSLSEKNMIIKDVMGISKCSISKTT
jgi:hypothetical protein